MQLDKFISFEGVDGAGKSTQIRLLAEYLKKQGEDVVVTREPGGVQPAEEIRKLLLSGDKNPFLNLTQVLLHFAARYEHVEKLIKPALNQGRFVISDRFFDSTYIYQSIVPEGETALDRAKIDDIKRAVIGGFQPKITFILDLPPEIAKNRMSRRADKNFYDKSSQDFHEKVRKGFLNLARDNQDRCVVIDASVKAHEVHERIVGCLNGIL